MDAVKEFLLLFRNKVFLISVLIFVVVLFVGGLLFHLFTPSIGASNIQPPKHELASNAPVMMTFNQLMDRSSVEKSFTIFPQIGGRFDWSFREMTFVPEERFRVHENYTITVKSDAANILGRPLGKDVLMSFVVVEAPQVLLAVPHDETAVDSKITVMFNRPMTELTTYDESESQAFPLRIEPALDGRFKWIGTSAFQYIPKERLQYSTEYTATIPAGIRSLDGGIFEKEYSFKFRTPRIASLGNFTDTLNASSPFIIPFSEEVNLESLKEHLKVMNQDGNAIDLRLRYQKRMEESFDVDGKKTEKEIEDKKIAEIFPAENDWGYGNTYTLSMSKGVSGVEGNLPSESEIIDVKFHTDIFLKSYFPDAKTHAGPSGDIVMHFDQEVNLASVRSHFSISPEVPFSAHYGKKCDPSWEPKDSPDEPCAEIDDLTVVVFTPQKKLKNVETYMVRLGKEMRAKNGIQYLKEDVSWSFVTADVFKILRSDPGENGKGLYKQVCLFTNNLADTKDLEKKIVFSPKNKGKVGVSAYEVDFKNIRPPNLYDDYDDNGGWADQCKPRSAADKYALEIGMLLDPSTKYTMTLPADTKDGFGQALGSDFVLHFTTQALDDRDTSLNILQTNSFAVSTLDQHAAPVVATRNLESFDLEICQLSAEKYVGIDADTENNGFASFQPGADVCSSYQKTTKRLKNVYWEKQYTEINLAAELRRDPGAGYYFIRVSSPRVNTLIPVYVFDAALGRDVHKGFKKNPAASTTLLQLTNLHLAVKSSRDTALFWATNLTTGKPVAGVHVRVLSEKGAAIDGDSVTDGNGLARRAMHDLPFQYALASAPSGEEVVVNTNWMDGIAPWDYNLPYSQVERYTQGIIYTDRPLYQPTHEVFFKGILREDDDVRLKMPRDTQIQVEIYDSRSANIFKKKLPVSAQGTFGGSLKLDQEAALGQYVIATCLSETAEGNCIGGIFRNYFHVEEYRKPEYKLDIAFSQDAYVDKDTLKASLDAQYFFGAPLPDAKFTWNIKAQNYYFDEYRGEWFSFTDYDTFQRCYFGCPYQDEYLANGAGALNRSGKYVLSYPLNLSGKDSDGKPKPPDSSKIYTVETTVQDANNQSVSGSKEIIVHRGEFYVGVKNDKYIVNVGESMPIKVITVDHKGQPVSGKSVQLELLKQNWKYVKKRNVDGAFYWDNEPDLQPVSSATVSTGEDGKAVREFAMKNGGEYLVKATGRDRKGNTFTSTVNFYVTTDQPVSWKRENNNRMELKLDKLNYEVGDVAKVLVKSPHAHVKALVTVERADIFETKIVDVKSNAQVIEVPITEKMIPNFYISVLEVKGGDKKDPPDFKLGYSKVMVDAKNKILNINLKSDKKSYLPREKVNLEIVTTNAAGKPVAGEVSLAVVDASLLALKGNPKRDLVNLFYNQRDLGVSTADNMTNFLERINVSDLKGAKGGSGKGASEFGQPRGKFEDTAFWRSVVTTDASGKATVSFTLPDNLTTWNIEAIGSTMQSLFGSTNATIVTQQAVIVRPVLPRFALFGDELRLGAIVHNFTGTKNSFTVTLDAKNLEIIDGGTKNVTIPNGGSEKILWRVRVPKVAQGTFAEVTFSAHADGQNGQKDAVVQKFPINSYSTPETVALSSFTEDISFTEKVLLPDAIDPDLGDLKITTGATIASYLSDSLNFLFAYPYGCTEQILSRLLPNIVIRNAVSIPGFKDKIKLAPLYDEKGKVISFDDMVAKTLQRLYQYQRPEGGWGYYPESHESYPSLTAYTVFGLDQLKKAGYSVDGTVFSRGLEYIQNYMKNNMDLKNPYDVMKLREKDSQYANNRAYLLFVLSEAGHGDIGLTNNLYEDKKLLGNGGKAYLAMTLKTLVPGARDKIDQLVKELENQARIDARGTYIRNDAGSSLEMMTNTKVTALVVQAFDRIHPDHPLMGRLVKWLIAQRRDGHWDTTQENVSALLALTEYLEIHKELDADYKAGISVGGKIVKEYVVNTKNILDSQEIKQSLKDFDRGGSGTPIVFSKEGKGRLYYDIVLRYFLPIEKIAPRSEGFVIQREYYRLDDTKFERPVTEAKAGETLHGHLTIVVPEQRSAVAVENFLPAGFELVNFDFENSKKSLEDSGKGSVHAFQNPWMENPWTFKELRNDRLFLFADRLDKDVYEYDYFVQVTSEGKFHHPPALVSEMYFPENFARTRGEWVEVR